MVNGDRQMVRKAVNPHLLALYLRVLGGDLGALQLWFDWHVLDRYRATGGWRFIRTDTVGRARSPEGWSLDVGIADGEQLIHAAAADIARHVPAAERSHWAEHLVAWPISDNFISMRLGAGVCIDDGDVRDWPA